MVAFYITQSFSGTAAAEVHIRSCNSCPNIWNSGSLTVGWGLDYEVYPPGISTPGTYIAAVTVIIPGPGGGAAIAGYASFVVGGAGGAFDFNFALSPSTITVKQGETATFQILLTYSDPSYSGTTIQIQVSGLGPGMNYHVITSPPTLQVSTSGSTPPSSYTITLIGSANGVMHETNAILTVEVAQPFDFSISLSPAQQTITPGGSTTSTVTVNLLSGKSESVTLSVAGAPNGVSASLSPTSETPSFTSTLSITTTSSVSPGQYPLTITGTSKTASHPTTFMLTVGQSPDFRIDATPPSRTATQGETATYQIDIVSLNGFNSQVTLSVSGLPTGAEGVFTTPSGTPNFGSALTITLPTDVPAGSYTLEVKGEGGGLSRTANLVLKVKRAAETSTIQTSTETSTTSSNDIMSMLQQNSLLILAVVVALAAAALVASRRKKPRVQAPTTQGPQSGVTYCPSCGHQNPAGNKFCSGCGAKL